MSLSTGKELLIDAQEHGYAIGAFNAYNMEGVQALVEAAQEECAPAIILVSEGAIEYAGLEYLSSLVRTAAGLVEVPVVLHLDHGKSLVRNLECLRAGFTSLMYDGSGMPLEENIAVSSRITEAAHACGIPVELELGRIPRIEEFDSLLPPGYDYSTKLPSAVQERVQALMADPDQAEEFVARTACDSLAVAIGSVHGMKRDVQPLDIARLSALRARTGVPLVLHGASGVIKTRGDAERLGITLDSHEGTLEDAIGAGIAKVNVGTDLSMSFVRSIRAALEEEPGQKDLRRVFGPGRQAVKDAARGYIRLFGSAGRTG